MSDFSSETKGVKLVKYDPFTNLQKSDMLPYNVNPPGTGRSHHMSD